MSTPVRRVLIHPDPLRLELELVARLKVRPASSGLIPEPALILAPTRRLVERLRSVLADAFPASLGIEVLHFQGLAFQTRSAATPFPAPRALLEAVVSTLAQSDDSALAAYLAPRPRAIRRLTGLFSELREAGITELPGADPSLERIFAGYNHALETMQITLDQEPVWADRAGMVRHAASELSERPGQVFVLGVHELIGSNLALLSALRPAGGMTFLLPVDAQAPGWEHARAFIRRHVRVEPERLPDVEPVRPHVALARALFDEGASGSAGEGTLRLIHAQGPEAELTFAARQAMRWIVDGTPPNEIAVLARTLEPYADRAETVFARHGLPVDASMGRSAGNYPKAVAFRLLLDALTNDFERQTVIDLVRSPFINRPENVPWEPQRWDAWSRTYRVVRSAESWIDDLPADVRAGHGRIPGTSTEEDREALAIKAIAEAASIQSLAGFVTTLRAERDAWLACVTGADHVQFLHRLAATWIRGWNTVQPKQPPADQRLEADINRALTSALDTLIALDARRRLGDQHPTLTLKEAHEFVESAINEVEIPRRDPGGLAFLDVMQARGLTFKHVIVLGFNADLIPRRAREDFFLPDALRAQLRTAHAPLTVSSESASEERLLFAQTLASATESFTVCWQRADADGKTRSPSLFLRALARLLPARPSLRELLEEGEAHGVERVPTHPVEAARWYDDHLGLLSAEEAVLLARDCAGADPHAPLQRLLAGLEDAPDLHAPLAMVRVVESMRHDDPRYDGGLDAPGWDGVFSPSSLERLGRCPQQFFFERILGVRALDERAEDRGLALNETGLAFHDVLELVVKTLDAEGWIGSGRDLEAAEQAAITALDRHWAAVSARAGSRVRKHLPGLWATVSATWKEELRQFVVKDVERLIRPGVTLLGAELPREETLALAAGAAALRALGVETTGSLRLRGRLDRLLKLADGTIQVSDYKTSGNLDTRANVGAALNGDQLQLVLYWLLVEMREGRAEAELLGLGPSYRPDGGFAREGATELKTDQARTLRPALEESLLVLSEAARTGNFPLRQEHRCTYCVHRAACRQFDYATVERQKNHPRYRDFQDVTRKGIKKPTLAAVRGETS